MYAAQETKKNSTRVEEEEIEEREMNHVVTYSNGINNEYQDYIKT